MEARVSFKREGIEGIVPVGSYLADAAKRLGVRFEEKCDLQEGSHFCSLEVVEGEGLLSPPTDAEKAYFAASETGSTGRLACQTRIDEVGELVVMTAEPKEVKGDEKDSDVREEDYAKKFADLPLEKKIAQLVNLEAITLGETVSFIANSPYMVFDKLMDVMAEFGLKKEQMEKVASRPIEHTVQNREGTPKSGRKRKPVESSENGAKEEA